MSIDFVKLALMGYGEDLSTVLQKNLTPFNQFSRCFGGKYCELNTFLEWEWGWGWPKKWIEQGTLLSRVKIQLER